MGREHVNCLKLAFSKNQDKIFLTESRSGTSYTYRDILLISLKLSEAMSFDGIRKGDKVVAILPNCATFVFLYFACMHLGAIIVPINIELQASEVGHLLNDIGSNFIFYEDELNAQLSEVIKDHCQSFGSILKNGLLHKIDFKNESIFDINNLLDKIEDDDIQLIIYTSGTTGPPKKVQHSYASTIGNAEAMLLLHNITSQNKFYVVQPLFYLGGFYNQIFLPFLANAEVVLDKIFDVEVAYSFWDTVVKYNVNTLWLIPSIVAMLLKIGKRADKGVEYCRSGGIKYALIGTAPFPENLKTKFFERFGVEFYENYGLSEILWVSSNSPKFSELRGVGKCLKDVMVYAIDEAGNRLGEGQIGEIAVVTPYASKGNSNAALVFDETQVFYTGDIGYVDHQGYLFITDRKKELIIKGGVNISPKEIEDTLRRLPLIEEVAILGFPDEVYGEKIIACIVASSLVSEVDIKIFCSKHLAKFKVPQHVFFMEEFPKNASGKIIKSRIKDFVASKLSIQAPR